MGGSYSLDSTTWTVDDPIGGSDHDPILIELHAKIKHVKAFDKSACWKSRGGDWEAFKSAVEEKIPDMDEAESMTIKERVDRFNKVLFSAAESHVGKSKPGKTSKVKRETKARKAKK